MLCARVVSCVAYYLMSSAIFLTFGGRVGVSAAVWTPEALPLLRNTLSDNSFFQTLPCCSCARFHRQVVKLMHEMSMEEAMGRQEKLAALQHGAVVWLMLPTDSRIYLGKGVVTEQLFAAEGLNLRDRYRLQVGSSHALYCSLTENCMLRQR